MEKLLQRWFAKDNKNLIFSRNDYFASCGADNIGVFVPYFTLEFSEFDGDFTYFSSRVPLGFLPKKLAQVPSVGGTLEKYNPDGLLPLSI